MVETDLHNLLRRHPQQIWRGSGRNDAQRSQQGTGFAALDQVLPGQGWPAGAVIEMIVPHWGMGELSLWLPAMRAWHAQGHYVSWLAPPYLPYPPALHNAGLNLAQVHYLAPPLADRDLLWAAEKLLDCGSCGLVLAWPRRVTGLTCRRLQLAAQQGNSQICLLRQPHQVWQATGGPSLRLRLLDNAHKRLSVRIEKVRGGVQGVEVHIADPRSASLHPASNG